MEIENCTEMSQQFCPGLKITPKSKFLLAHLKMAQLVKIPFIVFHLARLIFKMTLAQKNDKSLNYKMHEQEI